MLSFTLQPVYPEDFEALSEIGRRQFDGDSHTLLKRYGDVFYLRDDPTSVLKMKQYFLNNLKNPKRHDIKAVAEDGRVLGKIGIAYIGYTEDELARLNIPQYTLENDLESVSKQVEESLKQSVNEQVTDERKRAIDTINDLEAWEQEDWRKWEKVFMPSGSKSVGITGVGVDPNFQGQGIGTALVSWATKKAEEVGTYLWVHSSEAGWRTFKKCGLEEVGRLEVDLDEWAKKAGIEVPEGKTGWGVYICRWMKKEKMKSL